MGALAGTKMPLLSMIGVFRKIYVVIPRILLLDVSAIPHMNSERDTIKISGYINKIFSWFHGRW